jgi:gliding motility-associated-like protein
LGALLFFISKSFPLISSNALLLHWFMPKCFRYTPVFLLLSFWAQALYGQQPEQDCFRPLTICDDSYTSTTMYSGFGGILDVPANTNCLSNGEDNSSWFLFNVTGSGVFTFEIEPNNLSDDYDFALFNLSNDSCASIASGSLAPVRCNFSSTLGNTGLQTGAVNTQESTSGSNHCSPITVSVGQTYALLVNNFTASSNGYTLNLGGTASVLDNIVPHIDTVRHGTVCNPKAISIYLDEPILCNSISSDLSEITISGPAPLTISSFVPVGCNSNNQTSRINITFSANISVVGTYTITIQNGSDGNTFLDGCGNSLAQNTTYLLEIVHIGPTISVVSSTNSDCQTNTGAVDVSISGGQAPYTYSWNSNPVQTTQDLSNVGLGVYQLIVTDANGCTNLLNRTINELNAPTLTLVQNNPITCYGAANGNVTVAANGGTPPYSYTWNTTPAQTGPIAHNLSPGLHQVVVTDNLGCSKLLNVTTTQPTAIGIQETFTNTLCGLSTGTISTTVTGGIPPYSFTWNTTPPQTVANLSNLPVGIYVITVIDSNNCVVSKTIPIQSNTNQSASIQNVRPTCDNPSGSATAIATGPNIPYTFLWNTNPPQTSATATNLSAGTYFVIITGSDNCSQILNVKIDTVADVVGAIVSKTDASCGGADGSITVEGLVGPAPYSYNWLTSPAQNTATATTLARGNYDVIIEDANGCDDTITVTIGELVGTANFTWSQTCFGYPTQFQAQSNLDSVAFVWDFGDTASTAPSLDTGQSVEYTFPTQDSFSVTLISSGGCIQDTLTQTYAVNALPLPSFSTGSQNLYTENTYNLYYSGTPAISYFWDLGNDQFSSTASPYVTFLDSGIHQITLAVVDSNGCTDTIQSDLFVAKKPNIYMPNAFVPVTEAKNPIYKVYGYDIAEIDFQIFSRWGNVVYSTQSPNDALTIGWDGTFQGVPLPQGVYGYKIWVKFVDEREFEKTGTITLVR